jgi:arabinogalactan endo-1,4-beta-galactosidase
MIFMAEAYKKPIILAEVAYCASPTEYKTKPSPFAETPEGQRQFIEVVNSVVMSTPDNLGAGVFWWEPATKGGLSTRDFFDEKGNVLPVITVFDKFTRH